MSLPAEIILRIPDFLIGKEFQFNNRILIGQKFWKEDTSKEISESVLIEKRFLSIYCYNNIDPNNLGLSLLNHFNVFSKIFNLCLGGNCSEITETPKRYATRINEYWGYIKPKQYTNNEFLQKQKTFYTYVFFNNQWYILINDYYIPISLEINDIESYISGFLLGLTTKK